MAQALRRASLLGRVPQQVAQAAPLCVLVDMAALARRPGALEACLLWLLLKLPNLRAVRFAGGGKGSMVSLGVELPALLQLAAALPSATASLRHMGVNTPQLGLRFLPGGPIGRAGQRSTWHGSVTLSHWLSTLHWRPCRCAGAAHAPALPAPALVQCGGLGRPAAQRAQRGAAAARRSIHAGLCPTRPGGGPAAGGCTRTAG